LVSGIDSGLKRYGRSKIDTYFEVGEEGFSDGWNTFKFLHNHFGADDSIWELRVAFFVMVVQENDFTKKEQNINIKHGDLPEFLGGILEFLICSLGKLIN
jgi:hypothetical protein